MTVYVCVWFPKSGNIGHASLWVDGGSPSGTLYLSRWPRSLASILLFGDGADRKYDDDVDSEGGLPAEVVLKNLDETAIKAAMKKSMNDPKYGFLTYNCATNVSVCLNAGRGINISDILDLISTLGPGSLPTIVKRWGLSCTPAGVYYQALSLKK